MKVQSLIIAGCVSATAAFTVPSGTFVSRATQLSMAKGFGEKKEVVVKQKSEGQVKRDSERSKYDEISSVGGQEYHIFVRQFGSDDNSWFPCGAIGE